jgi:hypothetical protein
VPKSRSALGGGSGLKKYKKTGDPLIPTFEITSFGSEGKIMKGYVWFDFKLHFKKRKKKRRKERRKERRKAGEMPSREERKKKRRENTFT